MSDGLRIIVVGMVAGDPQQGGASSAVLQYVLGLRRLGHHVVLVEPIEGSAVAGRPFAESEAAVAFRRVAAAWGIEGALLRAGSTEVVGTPYATLASFARTADLVLNVAGMLTDPELLGAPARRAYLDLDPGFTQLWHATQGVDMRLAGHERHVTVGLQLGEPSCAVPTCGVDWVRIPPIVSVPDWPVGDDLVHDAFTTVGNWRSYGSIEHGGRHYGQRAHTMRALAPLPRLAGDRFAVALSIHPEETSDLALLRGEGWELLDPVAVAGDPKSYRAFVRGSFAEIGIPKLGYVEAGVGWFSDRSACYLSAGRPVVTQRCGFETHLPVGCGLLTYDSVEEAADAVRAVRADYGAHRLAARRIAEEHLAAHVVLPRLLDAVAP